jgi:hypothetical protein
MKISDKIIRNGDLPACKNCVHYRPSSWSNDFTSLSNKCEKFGEKDVVTDKIVFDYADSCRRNENKCGNEGKYFVKEPRVVLKKLKHRVFRPLTLFYFIQILYLVAFYLTSGRMR